MSWNNVIPAWLLVADSILRQHQEGRLDYERALKKLRDLSVPESTLKVLREQQEKHESRSDKEE